MFFTTVSVYILLIGDRREGRKEWEEVRKVLWDTLQFLDNIVDVIENFPASMVKAQCLVYVVILKGVLIASKSTAFKYAGENE